MSVHVMSWVLRESGERLGRRLVLLVLADHAHDDGTEAWPSVSTIAAQARLSERQARDCLRSLEASGAIERTGRSASGTNVYRVVMGGGLRPPEESDRGGAKSDRRGGEIEPIGRSKTAPDPSLEQPSKDPPLEPSPARADLRLLVSTAKVDGKPVGTETARLAGEVLRAWNEETGQSLTATDWLRKIVMRIREHPELSLDAHAALIRHALADPWWRGSPSPSVVYGNGAIFEKALTDARAAAETASDDYDPWASRRRETPE